MTDFRERLAEKLEAEEGCELMPYHCPEVEGGGNRLSIGVGRNLEERGITHEEAMVLLQTDIDITLQEIKSNFPWSEDLSDNRRLVLADMCFGLGITKLKKFKLMLAALEAGDYEEAARQLKDSLYARQLVNRSERNAALLLEG
tara:strand:- start:36 stop:467 length:432 start_codon:yes stop_codon:yes gene_type:complete